MVAEDFAAELGGGLACARGIDIGNRGENSSLLPCIVASVMPPKGADAYDPDPDPIVAQVCVQASQPTPESVNCIRRNASI